MNSMPRLYCYIGPKDILQRTTGNSRGIRVMSLRELTEWLRNSGMTPNREGLIALTFVVDSEGLQRVTDRCSEHVACARRDPVLSACEMFIRLTADELVVQEIFNQSLATTRRRSLGPQSLPRWIALASRIPVNSRMR
jgi:hypothetical protein